MLIYTAARISEHQGMTRPSRSLCCIMIGEAMATCDQVSEEHFHKPASRDLRHLPHYVHLALFGVY